jgi:dTDP-4-dehydrorhamnose 3,5-epimerase
MVTVLPWTKIFAETKPLSGNRRNTAAAKESPLMIDQLPEQPFVPLDQLGIWTNSDIDAAEVRVIGGASFACLGETGIVLMEPRVFRDHRGMFFETFHSEKFAEAGILPPFLQDNHSLSIKNVLRGLHYQIQQPQGKLIRVTRGEIFDVGVDLRRNSPTFGKWFGTLLSAENLRSMYLPAGFAHGFCAHADASEVTYKCTDLYAPQYERTLIWNDPEIGIPWPVQDPILAEKDLQGKLLRDADCYE